METKHTKGDWIPNDSEIRCNGNLIATAYYLNGYKKDEKGQYIPCEEGRANARLIASAPELLKALLIAQKTLSQLEYKAEIYDAYTDYNIESAIKKATL